LFFGRPPDCGSGDVEKAGGHDLFSGVLKVFGGVLDHKRGLVRLARRIPNHAEPVGFAMLNRVAA